MKKLLAYLVLISTSFCMPAYGQDDTIIITSYEINANEYNLERLSWFDNIEVTSEFKELILQSTDSKIMYSNGNKVNIRTEPNMDCDVIDQLLLNTSVEVIAEYNGWSCITGETGIGFVKSEYLQDTETTMIPLGEFKITHYCCEKYKHICGEGKGVTRSGTSVHPGIISVDPRIIPLGSKVVINGKAYLAEDTGENIKGYIIDMAIDTHQHALELGVYSTDVYLMIE